MQRRIFIKRSTLVSAGLGSVALGLTGCSGSTSSSAEADSVAVEADAAAEPVFRISLAEWSFHKALFNPEVLKLPWTQIYDTLKNDYASVIANSQMNHLDFPAKAAEMGFEGVEYVNTFFFDKAKDTEYLQQLKTRCADAGVQSLMIMCDFEGELGNPDTTARQQAVENHYKWINAAKYLGCHSIRVNAQSEGSYEEQQKLAADGLSQLAEYGATEGVNVIVENHGGLSSNGEWLAGVMKQANHDYLGTLPDFGNFCVTRQEPTAENPQPNGCQEMYDRYQGVSELMPYAKAVSAKTHDFNEQGQETETDYQKMMKIVLDAGYRGFVGVEYEGSELSEEEGVVKSKQLLEEVRGVIASQYKG